MIEHELAKPPPPPPRADAVLYGGPRCGERHQIEAGSVRLLFTEVLYTGHWCEAYLANGEVDSTGAVVLKYDPLLSNLYVAPVTLADRVRQWLVGLGLAKPQTITISAEGVCYA